jgi:HSP20 family molecular chaperone IbpA
VRIELIIYQVGQKNTMSIEPSDWFNGFFGANWPFRRSNPFEGFEEMRRDKEVKVGIEIPGVTKEQIKINANDNQVDIKAEDPKRKYHEVIDLSAEVDIENVKSTFINGLLEITFNKKSKDKTRGKTININ